VLRGESRLENLGKEIGLPYRQVKAVGAAGLETVEDLLLYLPFRYEDRRRFETLSGLVVDGPPATLSVVVASTKLIRTRRRGFSIFEAMLEDESGKRRAVWYNQPFLARVIKEDDRLLVFCRASKGRYKDPILENPDYEKLDDEADETERGIHTGRIVPVYRKLGTLTSKALRHMVHRVLDSLDADGLPDRVPDEIRRRAGVWGRGRAIRQIHFPDADTPMLRLDDHSTEAQRALAFEEAFLLQAALRLRQIGVCERKRGIAYEVTDALRGRLARLLPFKLTDAQKRVLQEIGADLRRPHPMHRLLQGDVGSGKTIVAFLALLVAVDNGFQGALMAPTEILAEQHFRNLHKLLADSELDVEIVFVSGSLKAAGRRAARAKIADGVARLVVGTHALFVEGLEFQNLGLAVIDEQHRFGVRQRAALTGKGGEPDLLVMTATPIPRSLALTLYGDLDISVIDELPPGRTPIRTVVRLEEDRPKVLEGIASQIAEGRQVYIVVPRVEEDDRSELKAVEATARELRRGPLGKVSIATLHGRMAADEKDEVMTAFRDGTTEILVATTVIEVGVDVPNATVMVVEHAERFGLSQLHQLRGRVGRGSSRSFCVLMVGGDHPGVEARERLSIMAETQDGFRIAERDLQIRGPGAVFGTQQHGASDLQFLADILRAPELLETARREARALVDREGGEQETQDLLDGLSPIWHKRLELGSVG